MWRSLFSRSRFPTTRARWARRIQALAVETRRGHNKPAIGLANKLARIVWAVWRKDVEFEEQMPQAA
jgi:hypothetical protein